jgi:hypothetical protein
MKAEWTHHWLPGSTLHVCAIKARSGGGGGQRGETWLRVRMDGEREKLVGAMSGAE